MTALETFLVLAVIPASVYLLVTLIALRSKLTRPRYRAGQDWDFDPVFWVANPAGVSTAPPGDLTTTETAAEASEHAHSTDRGGARGHW
ncbi:hypothetical protein ACL03H_13530 [Saccharopolyspora sp. MS10]|uniref:aa3-type cytochrome oxidase subunit CtaJ n=1 Tax=Saccharopolyspora sp. MS10 TaxID=3385973 RepID=UPI00399FD6E7